MPVLQQDARQSERLRAIVDFRGKFEQQVGRAANDRQIRRPKSYEDVGYNI